MPALYPPSPDQVQENLAGPNFTSVLKVASSIYD